MDERGSSFNMWRSTSSAAAGSRLNKKTACRSSTAMLVRVQPLGFLVLVAGFLDELGVVLPGVADQFVSLGEDEGPLRRRHLDVLIEFFEGFFGKFQLAGAEIEGEQGVVRPNVGRGHLHRLPTSLVPLLWSARSAAGLAPSQICAMGSLGRLSTPRRAVARARSRRPAWAASEISSDGEVFRERHLFLKLAQVFLGLRKPSFRIEQLGQLLVDLDSPLSQADRIAVGIDGLLPVAAFLFDLSTKQMRAGQDGRSVSNSSTSFSTSWNRLSLTSRMSANNRLAR